MLVMGILNVTPDSFADGGRHNDFQAAVRRGLEMIAEGVDIIDVGGESTRPGADRVSEEEETARTIPVIAELAKHGRGCD
jgi:dihydropteroate synthase